VPESHEMPYPQKHWEQKLPSMVYRRARNEMIETYKLIDDLVDSPQYKPLKFEGRYTGGHCSS